MPVTNNTLTLKFYNNVVDDLLLYAIILAKYENKWIFCKHKLRSTYEVPGGKRHKGETMLDAAKRELHEETGASQFCIKPWLPYSVIECGIESFGMIFYADVNKLGPLPNHEMESIFLFDTLPDIKQWTYPTLQPAIIQKYIENQNLSDS